MPVGGALDTIPIHLAVVLDIGKPGHFRMFGMTILDQRMHARRAEPPAEHGELARTEILVAEDKHRMFGECAPDPGKGRLIEWPREIDAQCLGAERLTQRAELRRASHGRSSDVVAKQARLGTVGLPGQAAWLTRHARSA